MNTQDPEVAQFIDRVRRQLSLVHSLNPDADNDDLVSLDAIVDHARVVGIGESWHSARQLLQFRHRMVRYLIEKHGFRLLIFEGSVAGAAAVDDYVKGSGSGPTDVVLRGFEQAMWLNRETADFIQWLRQHNIKQRSDEQVSVCGMDSVPPSAGIPRVLAYLERVDPTFHVPDRALLGRIAEAFNNAPLSSTSRAAIWGATEVFDKLTLEQRVQMRAAMQFIVAQLGTSRKSYESASSPTEFHWFTRHAVMVLQAIDILSARPSSPRQANHLRDLAFSENVAWLLDHGHPRSKAVIFGHNIHMAKEPFRSFDSDELVTSLGQRLAAWYGADYVAIGSTVGTGRLAQSGPGLVDIPAEANARRESSLRSIDAALEELGERHFILATPHDANWTRRPQSMRSHLQPSTDYTPAQAFDAFSYVDGIASATVLPTPPQA